MKKIYIRPYSEVAQHLMTTTIDDNGTEVEAQITGLCAYLPVIKSDEVKAYELDHMDYDEEFEINTHFVKVDGGRKAPVHPLWIEAIEINGEIYKINHAKLGIDMYAISSINRLATTKEHTYITIPDNEAIFDDSCCSKCGSDHNIDPEYGICEKCIDSALKINNHSFKPTPNFVGAGKYHFGIELELGFKSKKEAAKLAIPFADKVYLKSDSSISAGDFRAEVVSHPHTFEALMAEDSFLNAVDNVKVDEHSNHGCHIHISRAAFDNQKHFGLFYFLMYASKPFIEHIGGRTLNGYCSFTKDGTITRKENTYYSHDRNRVVNENNTHTIEIRIFNSTNKTDQLKRYVQFLASVIEYTRNAKTKVSLKDYIKFVEKNKTTYEILAKHIAAFDATLLETAESITYKQPTVKSTTITKLSVLDLPFITMLATAGEVYKFNPSRGSDVYLQGTRLNFNAKRGKSNSYSGYSVELSEIISIEVTK